MENLSFNQILPTLPPNVRAAIETGDAAAFQAALDELPCEQSEQIVEQLTDLGILGSGPAAQPEFQEILKEFELLIKAIVAVARGDASQRAQVLSVLPDLEVAGYHLEQAVLRIWDGERQAGDLTAGLDPNSARLVEHILMILAGEKPAAAVFDAEAVAASIPQDVMSAIVEQDEKAFKAAMDALSPADREYVAGQLARLQKEADREADAWLESLPGDVRQAILDQDNARLQEALQKLPDAQAEQILADLEAAGLLIDQAEPEADLLMTDFEPLVMAIVSVARGNESARPQVEALLADLDEQGWHLCAAVERIWVGERDLEALSAGLERQDRQIVRRIIQILEK